MEIKHADIGEIPENWQIMKLKDVCAKITDGSHKSPKSINSGNKRIASVKDIENGDFNFNICKKISEKDFVELEKQNCAPIENDVVLSKDGTIGLTFVYKNIKNLVLLSSIAIIRVNSKINPHFLNYYLKSKKIQSLLISGHSSGSGITRIVLKDLKELPIVIPEIDEQNQINKHLISLDDKIKNLLNQNKVLEQIAQLIFKSLFVNFEGNKDWTDSDLGKIPEGWKVDTLFNCANYVNGSAFKNQDGSLSKTGLPIIKIKELKSGINYTTLFTEKKMDLKYHLYNKDILFSWSGSPDTSIDIFIWAGGNAVLNQHIHKINLNNSEECGFIYFLLKYFKKKFIEIARNKQTTGLGHVTLEDLKNLDVVLPDDKSMQKSRIHLNPIFEQIYNNLLEIESLKKILDELITKLMFGKIRV